MIAREGERQNRCKEGGLTLDLQAHLSAQKGGRQLQGDPEHLSIIEPASRWLGAKRDDCT